MSNTPDWAAIESAKDAQSYSDLCMQADLNEANEARRTAESARIVTAIRSAELTPHQVRKLLTALAREMARKQYTLDTIEGVLTAVESI